MTKDAEDSFLSRWSRRKVGARAGLVVEAETVAAETPAPGSAQPSREALPAAPAAGPLTPHEVSATATAPAPPPPTMADVALLTRDADYTRYLGSGVSPDVRNAALKHLFTDPHFNVMDGLDTYLADYNTPDPLTAGMLRQMVQSQLLGLFDDKAEADSAGDAQPATIAAAQPAPTPTADPTCLAADENPDLQLQPDDGAGRPGAEPGAGAHAGRTH